MELGAIFLTLALALLVAIFIFRPFFASSKATGVSVQSAGDPLEHRRSALLADRDRLLTALQELDFDNALGKVPAEDYPQQRAVLLQQAAAALRQLDDLEGAGDAQGAQTAEDRVEQAVAVRRSNPAAGPGRAGEADELEAMIAARRKERQEKSAGFCPKCGRPVTRSDKFCSRCGATL